MPDPDQTAPPGVLPGPLTDWFGETLGARPPLTFARLAGGYSNLTFAVGDATGSRWVLRRPPLGHVLATAHDMGREARIMAALAGTGVPVPDVLGHTDDPKWNGAPFFVMSFVPGQALHFPRGHGDAARATAGRPRLCPVRRAGPDPRGKPGRGRPGGPMTETVRYEVAGPVATITLNRPDRLNAMTTELLEGVLDRLEQAAADQAVRVVVLTGAGRGFCAGGDLGETGGFADGRAEQDAVAELRRLHRSTVLLHEMPKPAIAAVNGPCAGAGLSWACACDLRIAAESAVFRTAFLSAGLTGDFGGTWSLARCVGAARARHLYLLNEKIDAATAASIGLVGEVVPDGDLAGRVAAIAGGLAHAPAPVVAGIKQNLNEALGASLQETLDAEAARQVAASLRLSSGPRS